MGNKTIPSDNPRTPAAAFDAEDPGEKE